MRTAILFALLLLVGCRPPFVKRVQTVADGSGTNELVLYDTATPWLVRDGEDHEFHSLVWRVKSGTNWNERAVISQRAFLAGTTRYRSIMAIDSLDTANGTAIIKVGEFSLPGSIAGPVTNSCIYSWREWNLLTNGEVRVLRICKDPFEKLTK